jgi:uncharacterized protein
MRSVVLISGATGGLGKAFAVESARRGWDLYLTDLNEVRLETLAASLSRTYGVNVIYSVCDLMDGDSRTDLFRALRQSPFRFKGLVNVAGLDFEGAFQERTRDQIRAILRLNVEGTLELTHVALQLMDPMQTFWIVTVSSMAAFFPIPVKATYAASKRFLLDFFLALRDEVQKQGATVTVLCPAGLPTTESTIAGIEAQGWMGQATTMNIGQVAAQTLDHALRGKAVVVPGLLNRVMVRLGSLVPPVVLSRLLGKRWRAARQNRADLAASLAPVVPDAGLETTRAVAQLLVQAEGR